MGSTASILFTTTKCVNYVRPAHRLFRIDDESQTKYVAEGYFIEKHLKGTSTL